MKRILYLLIILFCFAGCKKQKVNERIKFAKISFGNKTAYDQAPYVMYDGEKIDPITGAISLTYGNREFSFYKSNGQKFLDTILSITKSQNYYIYQPDTTKAAVILTELPPPPLPPAGPLDDATAAPAGYMKVKIVNASQDIIGDGKIDVEILSTVNTTAYELVATVPNVTASVGADFVQFQRPVRAGIAQTNFKFRFLRSDTKEPIKSAAGAQFITVSPLAMTTRTLNVYLLTIEYIITVNNTGIEKDGLLYNLKGRILDSK